MEKPAQEQARTKAVVRRKGWGTVAASGSSGLGGFLLLGGVLLATAVTAKAALKRRQRPGKDARVDLLPGVKDAAAAAKASGQSEEETTAVGGDRDSLVDHLLPSILPQPPVSPEQQTMVASTHADGIQRFDDVKESCAPVPEDPKDPSTKEDEQPETAPVLQDLEDSRLICMVDGHTNYGTTETGVDVLAESIHAEIGGAKCLKLEYEIQQVDITSQTSDKHNVNANKGNDHEGAGAGVDRTSILQLEDETLPEDTSSQASHEYDGDAKENNHEERAGSELEDEKLAEGILIQGYDMDNEEANLENNHEKGAQAETSPPLHVPDISMLLTSVEEQKNISAMNDDEPNIVSVSHDEALPEKVETDGELEQGKSMSNVEDKYLDKSEDNLLAFTLLEDQNNTPDGVHNSIDSLTDTVGLNAGEIGVIRFEYKDQNKVTPAVQSRTEEESDKFQIGQEDNSLQKKNAPSQDLEDPDHPTSTECHDNSSCTVQSNIDVCCHPTDQDADEDEQLLVQHEMQQEETFIEEPTSIINLANGDEPSEESAQETKLPFEDSKHPSIFPSLELHITASCVNSNQLDNISQKTSKDADQLGIQRLQDETQQDKPAEEAKGQTGKANNIGDTKDQYQVENVSDSSPDDSTGSSTEASWPMEETDSSSSDEYNMKSQPDIPKYRTESQKNAPNEENTVFHGDTQKHVPNQEKLVSQDDQQEIRFLATKIASLIKAKVKMGLPMKHARASSLQLAYPAAGLMLVLLIVCSRYRIFETCHLLYKLFYPSSSSV